MVVVVVPVMTVSSSCGGDEGVHTGAASTATGAAAAVATAQGGASR